MQQTVNATHSTNMPDRVKGRWRLFLIIAICAAPMIASYISYYIIKPTGRTNYGTILDPRAYPTPDLKAKLLGENTTPTTLQKTGLEAYRGKWIMLSIDSAACADACQKKLIDVRQLRLTQGKDMDRIERVWLLTDEQPIATTLLREHDGMHVLHVDEKALKAWLPVTGETQITDHIYLIDPLGNLMMRFPKDANPNLIKKDLTKLLRASAIG
ncbi:SCO family protein [Undibacterium sp. SXout20W]|uniref:SCO family protein n=1 Tax=Undibacterium sp. SXout20W TaxID=3413051 RepID=UPI003BF35651